MNAGKIARQPKLLMISWPTEGAIAGTSMNTVITNEVICAIRRPS